MCAPIDTANAYRIDASTDANGAWAGTTIQGRDLLPDGCARGRIVAVGVLYEKASRTPVRPVELQVRRPGSRIELRAPIALGDALQSSPRIDVTPARLDFDGRENLELSIDRATLDPDPNTGGAVAVDLRFYLFVSPAPAGA